MAGQVTNKPPFQIPTYYKKSRLWAERRIYEGYSDGDQRYWPPTPPYRPSSDEFYLCNLGQKWAETDGIAKRDVQYYLDKLPRGYAMFETDQPGGPQTYKRLFGHPTGRFYDSAPRFAPHFIWLMSGMDGECECFLCGKKGAQATVVHRRSRAPRETIDQLVIKPYRPIRQLTDDDDADISSRGSSTGGGIATKRSLRQPPRPPGAPLNVDEEGTKDIYKDCVKSLEGDKGGKMGIEIDLTEEDSIDWIAERESLPQYLTQIEQQHCFVPRIGELVIWTPIFLDEHHLMLDKQTSEYKFYSFEQNCFHGFPPWRGGVVTSAPSASVKNGPIDFTDVLDTPNKKTAFNTAGFRIETMPDPNDDMDKAMSKQYKYVPLRNIRPLSHWQLLLKGIPQSRLHPSIEHALTCMTSISLVEKCKFNGDWPSARIFCKGVYLGSEFITVGDTIRVIPSKKDQELRPDVVVVESIRYNLLDMRLEHTQPENPNLCGRSFVSFTGSAYTKDLTKLIEFQISTNDIAETPSPLKTSEVKQLFRSVGAEEYGLWYPWHGPRQRYEVSHEQVLGRMYEADAVRLWTGQRQVPDFDREISKPSLNFDAQSVLAGRTYATATDARLQEPQSRSDINWYITDTRVEALAVATINGIDVGKYHDIRTPPTVRQWRIQLKVADGQPVAPEAGNDEFLRDLSQMQLYTGAKRGRPAGSKLVDGKLVRPGQLGFDSSASHSPDKDKNKNKPKPSSQMAGAALATDNDDSSEEYFSDNSQANDLAATTTDRSLGRTTHTAQQTKSNLSKAAIMSSIEVPEDQAFDDDVSDEETWWENPPLARGGTEESSGGDYRE